MSDQLTLLMVHAHPDDEATGTGGSLAKYAEEGVRTVIVTCTGGEVGEISDSALATPENLAMVRAEELRAALQILGVTDHHSLGYRDSGMAGTADNEHPESFHQANVDDATRRLVRLLREHRPQALVTYDENGFYGHPDHIMAHRITVAAFDASGDASYYPELELAPWAPAKLYATAVGRSKLRDFGRLMRAAGVETPFDPDSETDLTIGVADELVTTVIDVARYVERKRRALLAHRTQIGTDSFFAKLTLELFQNLFGFEGYTLLRSRIDAPMPETDLFAGIR
ncbi:MAG: N-acetyl-1-D-myo-inositol-2-amino-2-deoxy-alpha-D-glucopyranoside deacetylase [Chloroflexi bacterium]|nr:N-acetyl-1-D-myo-inositol-2-amino-2-deoxy-alpha-D-glucopyranoside deacetylase [Chloroflexota bacterium]